MNILIVEDSEPDQVIMKEAFKEASVQCKLWMVKDGVEALDFLNRRGVYQSAPKPHLIIMDLNLPKKNGREVLGEIRNDPKLEHLPVLVLSNSESPRDICQCYSLGVNAYINKPSIFQDFINLANIVDVFWLKLVKLCPH